MWIITVHTSKQSYRDGIINNLVGEIPSYEEFLYKVNSNSKYSNCTGLHLALTFKTEGGAARVVSDFTNDPDRGSSKSRYYWIKDKHLSYRKISKEEWNRLMDDKENSMKEKHRRELAKLDAKRWSYR